MNTFGIHAPDGDMSFYNDQIVQKIYDLINLHMLSDFDWNGIIQKHPKSNAWSVSIRSLDNPSSWNGMLIFKNGVLISCARLGDPAQKSIGWDEKDFPQDDLLGALLHIKNRSNKIPN